MKTTGTIALLLPIVALACDESKYDKYLTPDTAASAPPTTVLPPPPTTASAPPAPTWTKKLASDCKPHPTSIDFTDQPALEADVRKKLGKDTAPIAPAELAQIKSINVSQGQVHYIDPCIFPMFSSLKDLFLGPGEYVDLTPIQKLTTLESLRAASSPLKDLRPIEGLKRLDRLDLSHTLVGDKELESVGSLVNLTELMLDEDQISDLTPVSNLKKLMRLSIKKTQVKNLAPLAGIKTLKFLYIAETPVTDISPVQPLISGGMKLIQN
jgi:Leucine-rich repeat (LRR) protein